MKKIILLTAALLIAAGAAYPQKYLKTIWNAAEVDTVGTAGSNDTSRTFLNPGDYSAIWLEYFQNSVWRTVKLDYPAAYKYRVEYTTADSSFQIEVNHGNGWIPVPVFNYSTDVVRKFAMDAKTGTAFIRFRYFR